MRDLRIETMAKKKPKLQHKKINKQEAKLAFKAMGCYTQVDSF